MLRPTAVLKHNESFRGKIVPGVVIENDDPKKIMRCRVRVAVLHRDVPDADVPWALPMNLSGQVGLSGGGAGIISVPVVGAKVALMFMDDSLEHPAYISWRAEKSSDIPAELLVDYPDAWGFIDGGGNLLLVNNKTGQVKFHHNTGTLIDLQADGDVAVTTKKDLTLHVNGTTNIAASGQINIHSGAKVDIRAGRVELNPSTSGASPSAATPRSKPTTPALPSEND